MRYYEVPTGWTAEVIVAQRDGRYHGNLELRFNDQVVGTVVASGMRDIAALMRRLRLRTFETAVRHGLVEERVLIKEVG